MFAHSKVVAADSDGDIIRVQKLWLCEPHGINEGL